MRGVHTYISLFFMHFTDRFRKSLKGNYEKASISRTMARAEPQPPQSQVERNASGTRVLRV